MGIPYFDNIFNSALEDFERRTGAKPGVKIMFCNGDTLDGKQSYYIEILALGKSVNTSVTDISFETIEEMCRVLRHAVGDIREIRLEDFDVAPYSGNYINVMEVATW